MQDTRKRNDDVYVREGGPYADLIRDLVESGRYESAAEVVFDALSLLRDQELLRKARQVAQGKPASSAPWRKPDLDAPA